MTNQDLSSYSTERILTDGMASLELGKYVVMKFGVPAYPKIEIGLFGGAASLPTLHSGWSFAGTREIQVCRFAVTILASGRFLDTK